MSTEKLLNNLTVETWHPCEPGEEPMNDITCLSTSDWQLVKLWMEKLDEFAPLADVVGIHWCAACKKVVFPNVMQWQNTTTLEVERTRCTCPYCEGETLSVDEYTFNPRSW